MLNQYSRQQNIEVIEKATYTSLKYWEKMHSILRNDEK